MAQASKDGLDAIGVAGSQPLHARAQEKSTSYRVELLKLCQTSSVYAPTIAAVAYPTLSESDAPTDCFADSSTPAVGGR